MSNHTEIRLETLGGTVIAYFAPNFTVRPTFDNDLKGNPLPREETEIVRDLRVIQSEVAVQGVFEDSRNLPDAHKTALENLFGTAPVTPRMQVNRILDYMYTVGGPYGFYEGDDEYTAENSSNVDWANGVKPVVNISQFRPPSDGGLSRFEYMVQLKPGVER
jgi:hypothetical protein